MSSLRQRRGALRLPKGEKVLQPIVPNAGIEAAYRRKILKLTDEMNASVCYWLKSAYGQAEPILAQDEQPANFLQAAVRRLIRRWQRKFNQAGREMAEHFAKAVSQRSDFALQKILRDSGWSVEFRMTEAQRDVINATVNQNVSLIKSIPQRYLGEVEGMVMRSVQSGRDLGQLTKDLQKSYGVTRRRAALIARDQNNKATSALQNARQRELGITEAIWVHSTAGKEPRPTHLANNGKRYEVSKGWYDPAVKDWIFPGQLINCRCFSRPVIKGFS